MTTHRTFDTPATLHTIAAGDIAIRADADGADGRTIEGYAYRWGELTDPFGTAEFGSQREGFDRGAFAQAIAERAGRPFAFLDRHRERGGQTVGAITFREDDIGLAYTGRLLDTQRARDYAAEVAAGMDGVSLEMIIGEVRRTRGAVWHTRVRRLAGLAGEYVPAFRGATVAVRRDDGGTMHTCQDCGAELTPGVAHSCSTGELAIPAAPAVAERGVVITDAEVSARMRSIATEAAQEVMRSIAERGLDRGRSDPFAEFRQYATLGDLVTAAFRSGASPELRSWLARAIAARALDDTVSTSGANAALLTGNLTVSQIAGIVSRGRPAITAFGGPRGAGDVGMSITWPYFDGTLTDFVGAQSAEKAAITSASLDIKLGTEALLTYAGGSDVAYQLITRANPSVLDALMRVLITAWAVVTDAAFVTELESGSVTGDLAEAITAVDLTELTNLIVTNSIAVETATGAPAEFILAGTGAFTQAAKLIAPSSTQVANASGMDLRGLRISLGNLPIIHVPSLTSGKFIASNTLAAGWHEAGPFQATAEDVEKLGRNVAIWSMGAGARYIPAGIIEIYDVTP